MRPKIKSPPASAAPVFPAVTKASALFHLLLLKAITIDEAFLVFIAFNGSSSEPIVSLV